MWVRLFTIAALTIAALTISTTAAQNPVGPIAAVGTFFNPRYAEDRTAGYTVQLWRQGDIALGLISVEALSGDGPIGMLTNIKFEERTGKLSFEAKLSLGMRLLAGNSQQASRDLFRFRGTVVKDILSGNLTHSDLLDPASGETSMRLRLPKQAAGTTMEPKTYAEWKAAADESLKLRGPKWE